MKLNCEIKSEVSSYTDKPAVVNGSEQWLDFGLDDLSHGITSNREMGRLMARKFHIEGFG